MQNADLISPLYRSRTPNRIKHVFADKPKKEKTPKHEKTEAEALKVSFNLAFCVHLALFPHSSWGICTVDADFIHRSLQTDETPATEAEATNNVESTTTEAATLPAVVAAEPISESHHAAAVTPVVEASAASTEPAAAEPVAAATTTEEAAKETAGEWLVDAQCAVTGMLLLTIFFPCSLS